MRIRKDVHEDDLMNSRLVIVSLAIMLVLTLLIVPIHAATSNATLQISVSDPTGDDRGPGYYGYPSNSVFKPGVFDLTKFQVLTNDTSVIFKVYVKDLGDNPWKGPNGFCLQYVQIYVHTTLQGVESRMDTFGLHLMIRSDYAWHFAVLLAPGWGNDPVPKGQRSALVYANGTVIVQDDKFKVYADPNENAIVAVISKGLIPDVDNIKNWKIIVALASYDGFGPMKVRQAGVKGGEWVLNATKYATSKDTIIRIGQAIAKGIEPLALDLIVYSPQYPNGISAKLQYEWLNTFNVTAGTYAIVPGIATAPKTVTETITNTYTTTFTTTYTYTKTTTKTSTTTYTTTYTKTTTSVSPSPTTITETTTNWTATGAAAIILFIIGLIIGYLIKRK